MPPSEPQPRDLDFTGLTCPLPVLRANKRLRDLPPGTEVRIHVTDPAAPDDFRAFCETTGHVLLSIEETGEGHVVRIRTSLLGSKGVP